ncbi:hypothetical protein D3C77_584120 [compost metagenome]
MLYFGLFDCLQIRSAFRKEWLVQVTTSYVARAVVFVIVFDFVVGNFATFIDHLEVWRVACARYKQLHGAGLCGVTSDVRVSF